MPQPRLRPRHSSGGRLGGFLAILAFVALYTVAARVWHVPAWVAGLYGIASLVCFIAYALDKAAARAGRWRISERTLILLGLAGGWPGALVAQRTLRHKSSKASFLAIFWGSVLVNVGAFVALAAFPPFQTAL